MELYQAGYTRRGRQGEGAGWSLVSESEGMSQKAKDGFGGFAGNLAELVQSLEMPDQAVGIFQNDRFLYYLHINYNIETENAEDYRGVSFTHGYCFDLEDYYVLCEKPEQLLGITDDGFVKNYDPNMKSYPVAEELPHHSMEFEQLKEKYQLSDEAYRRLLIGATCAIEGYTDPLCIKVDAPKETYIQICREIMYLIMLGLPYHLRIKVTFFSYKGGKTSIYFSDKIEGSNYFDLDTKAFECDKSRLEKYRFTLLYSGTIPNESRQYIWQGLAAFIQESFDIPLKEIDCEQIEHGFIQQLKEKKLDSKDILMSLEFKTLLISFMGTPLKRSEAADEYLSILLATVDEQRLLIEDKNLLNQVVKRAQASANMSLQKIYPVFYVRQILAGEKEDSFETLWKQYQADTKQYHIFADVIKKIAEEFYWDYFINYFLPKRLISMESFISYLKESNGLEECLQIEAVKDEFDKLYFKSAQKELEEAKTFIEQFEVHKKAEQIMRLLKTKDEVYVKTVDVLMWSQFDISSFDVRNMYLYKLCSLESLSKSKESRGNRECVKRIKTVHTLVNILEKFEEGLWKNEIYPVFFGEEKLDDEIKRLLLKIIKKNYLSKATPISSDDFDVVVMCHYDLDRRRFDVIGLIEHIYAREYEEVFELQNLRRLINRSEIFADERLKNRFRMEIEPIITEKGYKDGKRLTKLIFHAVKQFYSCLTNEVIEEDEETKSEEQTAIFSVHKVAVGFFVVFSIAFFFICLKQYTSVSTLLILGVAAIEALIISGILVFKMYNAGGLAEYLKKSFINTKWLLLGTGGAVFLGILTVLIGVLLYKLPVFQQTPYLKTIVGVIMMVFYLLLAIAGAVFGSLGEDKE